MQNHILSIILFTPLLGALVLLFVPKENKEAIRWIANFFALGGFLISLPLVPMFWAQRFEPGFKFIEGSPGNWIPTIGAGYLIGIDGISFLLIMLTTLLGWISILSSWTAIENRVKEYYVWFLILQTGMLGVFMALDFFLFFVFWEAMLVPMYLLIGIWGGPRKLYAAIKFFLYTLAGSVLMLLGILFLYFHHHALTGIYTFSLTALYQTAPKIYSDPAYGPTVAILLFFAFFFAFAIKVPMFPFHTWLPDAHVEAPTAGSVILAGVLLKMGTYGFIRFSLPFFPDVLTHTKVRSWMIVLSIIAIIYGALVSLMQKDMKKLVAYSSVSHLGFCTLGIFALTPLALSGSVLQQVNHGISTGALFLIVGILYERRHPRDQRIWRHLERDARLCNHHHDHVSFINGAAVAERLCRRVRHSARHVHGELALGRMGRAWRGSRCRLPSVAISARILRPGHQSQERKAARSHASRNAHICASADHGLLDWALSQAFLPDS
jgi:NADH-quinone oxidoreductase subunit M